MRSASGPRPFELPPTIGQEIARVLAERIVHGQLAVGERLVEERLAAEFSVSRLPVRDALRALERDGLVLIAPRRGAIVHEDTADEIANVYACRVALEGMSARLAAERITPIGLAELTTIVTDMGRAVTDGRPDDYFELNVRFHDIVARASRNPELTELLGRLGRRVLRMRFASLSLAGRNRYSLEAHRRILAALKRRDGVEAEAVTRDLIATAGSALRESGYSRTKGSAAS